MKKKQMIKLANAERKEPLDGKIYIYNVRMYYRFII